MRFYYFNSTHWDREWYEPLQKFRRNLVDTTSVLLDALEYRNGKLDKFTFDGQTIVLDDVTEIHPEWKERLTKQIAAGRLKVGPWYVQPDELLPSGESLVRNLLIGRETARKYGAAMAWPVCYVCDMFGHIAQTPQIFNGFDIHQAVLWRGVDREFPPFFRWRSPDGSVCDTIRLYSRFGYAEFAIFVLGLWEKAPDEESFKKNFRKYVNDLTPYFGENILLSDALDHIMPRIELEKIFGWIKELYPDAEIIHTDYTEMRELFHDKLPTITGELIRTADKPDHFGMLLTNTLSARYDIKEANDKLQNRLELQGGAVQALAGLQQDDTSYPYWKLAWKRLVANQAHDSIGGCSVDAVHRRMLADFEEIGQLCDLLDEDLLYKDRAACTGTQIRFESNDCELAIRDADEADPEGNYLVRIYNALPFQRQETVDFEIKFPAKAPYPQMGGEMNLLKPFFQFNIFDEQNQPVPFNVNQVRNHQVRRFYRHDSREYTIYKVSAPLNLRASGWTTLSVRPSSCPVRRLKSMLTSPMTAENDALRLTVHADGTFSVLDRRSGRSYDGLNNHIIDREIGDGWFTAQPQGAQTILGSGTGQAAVLEHSPFRTTFLLTRTYQVPQQLDYTGTLDFGFDQIAESTQNVTLTIRTALSLEQGSDLLQARTVIDNNVKDCRVRLVMPAFATKDYFVYQNYAFLNRPVGRRSGTDSESWPEAEPLEKNFSGIAGKRDARGGVAFMSTYGLHEIAADNNDNGDFYVTLYRAFGRTVRNSGGVDGQLQKTLTMEYAYCFFTPDCAEHDLFNRLQAMRCKPLYHSVAASKCTVPAPQSAVTLTGAVGYCSLSPAFANSKGAIIRLVNLSQQEQPVTLTFANPVDATLCELDEERETALPDGKACRQVSFSLAPAKIGTVMLRTPQED